MSTRSTVLGLAVVGAFVVGRYLAPDSSAVATPASAGTPRPTTILREIVRPEPRPEAVARIEAPRVEEPVAPDDPIVIEQRAMAQMKAAAIVDAAVHAQRWTGADAAALLEVLPQLDGDSAATIMRTLITPINAGRMKLETSGSVLDPS